MKIIWAFSLIFVLSGCGGEEDTVVVEKYKDPPDLPDPGPGDGKPTYAQMQLLLTEWCEACHATAQFMQSESALRASDAKEQIWSDRMPKNATLPPDVKNRMLAFF